jgi:hypothetical protein
MSEERIETLLKAETNLNRAFWAAAAGVIGTLLWAMFVQAPKTDTGSGVAPAGLVLALLQFGCYVWYAFAAGAAAKALGATGWIYIAWILAAPFLAMLPIPIVSTVIGVSPLSIKFLLGGQLQTAIRQEGFAGIHASL